MVKSRFFPNLDMLKYWESLSCDAGLPKPFVNIQSINLNERGARAPLIDGVGGPEEDVKPGVEPGSELAPGSEPRKTIGQVFKFARETNGNIYLTPVNPSASQPAYARGPDVYPAVSQLEEGHFAKGYFGFLKIAEPDQYATGQFPFFQQASMEPRVLDHMIYVFSLERPETWYTSLLCSLEAQDENQMLVLLALTKLPQIGDGIDLSLVLVGALCDVSKGEYQNGLMRIGYAVGKDQFGVLVKEKLIPEMTEGKLSTKLFRFLEIDATEPNKQKAKAVGEALKNLYDVTETSLEAYNWTPPPSGWPTPPPPTPSWPSPPAPTPSWPNQSTR